MKKLTLALAAFSAFGVASTAQAAKWTSVYLTCLANLVSRIKWRKNGLWRQKAGELKLI